MSFWEDIEQFDPRTADPHFCWALLQMERESYLRIQGGKIIPLPKLEEISPQDILDRSVPRYQCNLAKGLLMREADGFLTLQDGVFNITDKGKADDEARDRWVEADDEIVAIAQRHQLPGESIQETFERLLDETAESLPARFAGVERNDPCPCGSGLKYKECCLLGPKEDAESP